MVLPVEQLRVSVPPSPTVPHRECGSTDARASVARLGTCRFPAQICGPSGAVGVSHGISPIISLPSSQNIWIPAATRVALMDRHSAALASGMNGSYLPAPCNASMNYW